MKKIKKIALYVMGVLVVAIITVCVISPFKYHSDEFRTVEASIAISTPVDTVFNYMGNSSFAGDWSSYVDHISPLNIERFKDGEVNSERRVFLNANEEGAGWDEKIIDLKPNHHRTLSIYNLREMSLSADGLQTEQRYEKVSEKEAKLSLILYFNEESNSYWNQLWMHIASFKIKRFFEKNLVNIKRKIESRANE